MKRFLFSLFALSLTSPLLAAEAPDELKALLGRIVPDATPDAIEQTPVDGLYEVVYGTNVFYFSADGKYMLRGDLIDMDSRVNLTESRRDAGRSAAIARLDEKDMVVFAPEGEVKHTITVFTDVDCGYCRKLHSGVGELNAAGVKVRYLAFPRAGVGSPTYAKMESVWCAEDRQEAMNQAKAGKVPPEKKCDVPFLEHLRLVREFGLSGTPAIVLEDGTLIGGYVPPKQLISMLEGN